MAHASGVARPPDLRADRPLPVHIEGVDLVLLRHDDSASLFEGRCPHQDTLLTDGSGAGGERICRGHGWRFACALATIMLRATVRGVQAGSPRAALSPGGRVRPLPS